MQPSVTAAGFPQHYPSRFFFLLNLISHFISFSAKLKIKCLGKDTEH